MRDLLRILKSARSLWPYYLAVSVFTVLLALMNLMQPMFSGWAIDEMRKGTDASVAYVVWLAIGIFGLDLFANLFSNFGGFLGDQLSVKLNRFLSRNYYEHLLKLPQHFYDTELSGKIINRLSRSINQISNFVQMVSNNFLQFLFTTVFTLVVVAHYSWPVALMLLAVYPLYIFLTATSSPPWRVWQRQKNQHLDIASGRFSEVIHQIKVVKSFRQEKYELKFFENEYDETLRLNRPQSAFWHRHDVYRRLVLNLIFLGVYAFIFVQGAHGNLSPGAAVALILYAIQIRTPIFTISFMVDIAQRAVADSREYFEIMDIEPQISDVPHAKKLRVRSGEIVLDNVAFGYEPGKTVLSDISAVIPPGSKIALVGESGQGKTTLTNLLLRLYEPTAGKVLIDGQDITRVTQASLRANIGVVFQEPALFSGTIRENIAYSNPKASHEQVMAAAKAANAHEFIERFELGYETLIGERGLRLSGGQKQRIAIARALLKDAPILILDEATSSLDSKSEQLVQEALENLMTDRTTIIIAHRLSTIQHVDRIITLNNGTIEEIGSPEELAVSGGIYSRLLRLQQRRTKANEKQLKAYDIASE